MKDSIPIIFSSPLVRAILDERKTQTRRLVRWPDEVVAEPPRAEELDNLGDGTTVTIYRNDQLYTATCPQGGEGDELWVRENFRLPPAMNPDPAAVLITRYGIERIRGSVSYDADFEPWTKVSYATLPHHQGRRRIGRFLPRVLARLRLRVKSDPDMQRLLDVTERDARAEGIVEVKPGFWGLPHWEPFDHKWNARDAFLHLFRTLNNLPEELNPWVWKTSFARA